jgi:hypothetical protein
MKAINNSLRFEVETEEVFISAIQKRGGNLAT